MKDKAKQNVKPAVNIKPAANIRPAMKQESKGQNRLILFLSFLFLSALFVSFIVPVYYVPLFSNIASKYGLSVDISRKLTLLDLALSSLGIETPNMASAFKQQEVIYEPEVFLVSRFNMDGSSHLINAKETYYHEYERTRKRPAEVAGIYNDGKSAGAPRIDGDLRGVRALPEDNYFDDDNFGDDSGFTKFGYKRATATTANSDEVMGSKRRQVRGNFDRQTQGSQGGQAGNSQKPEPLPDFASSIYDKDEKGETQTLENSRMVKPVVSGQSFSVLRTEHVVSQLMGDSSFMNIFSPLKNFGGYNGVLGYYIKDDLPTEDLFNMFGNTGKEMFSSYFYSNAAVGRKYDESSKQLAEIAFNGEEPLDEILIARGQSEKKFEEMEKVDMSPIELILTLKENIQECKDAGDHFREIFGPLNTAYNNAREKLKQISQGPSGTYFEGIYENVAESGVPGSCEEYTWVPIVGQRPYGRRTFRLRKKWNDNVDTAKAKCIEIWDAMEDYANGCKMDYLVKDNNKETCESIEDLRIDGGTDWWSFLQGACRRKVIWHWPSFQHSKNFHGCGGLEMYQNQGETAARQDCKEKVSNLFTEIDGNWELQPKPGFMFVD